jgi:hypothetical protein
MMMRFVEFKTGPVASLFAALGDDWCRLLGRCTSYAELRDAVVTRNDTSPGAFSSAIKDYAGVCSSGERCLAAAVCTLCDFDFVADEIYGPMPVWQNIVRGCSAEYRARIAACIEQAP